MTIIKVFDSDQMCATTLVGKNTYVYSPWLIRIAQIVKYDLITGIVTFSPWRLELWPTIQNIVHRLWSLLRKGNHATEHYWQAPEIDTRFKEELETGLREILKDD